MSTDEKLRRGLYLKEQIRELNYFLNTIKPVYANFDLRQNHIFKVKTQKTFSIFGSRSFGCGTHTQEIKIPLSMSNELYGLVLNKLEQYKREYSQL